MLADVEYLLFQTLGSKLGISLSYEEIENSSRSPLHVPVAPEKNILVNQDLKHFNDVLSTYSPFHSNQ